MANKRLKIPDDVRLKLWVLSGGRCEFPGCNEQVWKDGLTLKEDNFAHMAHLVAASPDGPRGDKMLSPQMAQDFDNLMLVCLKHSKLIDGKHKGQYTLEALREYKVSHEERVRIQTSIAPDKTTTVLKFVANVRGRKMDIPTSHAHDAILPMRYPYDEKGIFLDFSNRQDRSGEEHWKGFVRDIDQAIDTALAPGNDHRRVEHLSIFAIAPIPLLVYLGHKLGGTRTTEIFQKQRDIDDWKWKKEPRSYAFDYMLRKNTPKKKSAQVGLILSLSGNVGRDEVAKVLPTGSPWYEITIPKPNRFYLEHRSQLDKFAKLYSHILADIRTRYGGDCEIWLFPAAPVSVMVTSGRVLLPKSDPHLVVYDNANDRGVLVRTLNIN